MTDNQKRNQERVDGFFRHFKDKCPKKVLQGKHSLDDERKCKKCGLVSNSNWKLTQDGIEFYELYVYTYEKTEIRKKICQILNKISHKNFDLLSKDLIKILKKEIETPTQIHEASKQLFEKILLEKQFIPMYASLCLELTNIIVKGDKNIENIKNSRKKYEMFSFIDELIHLIQKEHDEFIKKILNHMEISDISKKRIINNTELIGEMYIKKLIHVSIIQKNIKKILNCLSKNINADNPIMTEELIEILCKILTVSGENMYIEFDRSKIDQYFQIIDIIKPYQNQRMKFIIMDVEDLYKKWKTPVIEAKLDSILNKRSSRINKANRIFDRSYSQSSEISSVYRTKKVLFSDKTS